MRGASVMAAGAECSSVNRGIASAMPGNLAKVPMGTWHTHAGRCGQRRSTYHLQRSAPQAGGELLYCTEYFAGPVLDLHNGRAGLVGQV